MHDFQISHCVSNWQFRVKELFKRRQVALHQGHSRWYLDIEVRGEVIDVDNNRVSFLINAEKSKDADVLSWIGALLYQVPWWFVLIIFKINAHHSQIICSWRDGIN